MSMHDRIAKKNCTILAHVMQKMNYTLQYRSIYVP